MNSLYINHLSKNSAGRISFTSDVWSRTDLSSFMAVTAHYLLTKEGRLSLCNQLVVFHHIQGSHTGDHLAEIFLRVLQELSVLDRVRFLHNYLHGSTMKVLILDWYDYPRQRIQQQYNDGESCPLSSRLGN